MNLSRRHFLAASAGLTVAAHADADERPPWDREESLLEAAHRAQIESPLSTRCPQPDPAMLISTPEMKATLWGPPERITLSLLKNDVWDRRVIWVKPLTLAEIRAGAFSPANRGFDDMIPGERRPMYGCLAPEGGRVEPYRYWRTYPFPCQKPVGQIILGLDDLAGAATPRLHQSCADGVVRFEIARDAARASIESAMSMSGNVIAIRGRFSGLRSAPWVRVFRHQDQAHRLYMTADGKFQPPPIGNAPKGSYEYAAATYDYQADAAVNGPIKPPESGSDGRYFWIRQRLPAEKTFPLGFEYVLMGAFAGASGIQTADAQKGLGTPPALPEGTPVSAEWFDQTGHTIRAAGARPASRLEQYRRWYDFIREAPGSAATARPARLDPAPLVAYFAVVTSIDAADVLAEGRKRLAAAQERGFDALVEANARWYRDLYQRRENGRIFFGGSDAAASEEITAVYRSWYIGHGGATKTDARKLQASASYATVEQDSQQWHGLPCYNELFYTPAFVRNRGDSVEMWKQLVEHWWPAARRNVREVFDLPGGAILHGYLPPIRPDRYVHTNSALELCLDTAAQVLRPLWDEWDYGGDEAFLREYVYPPLKDLALFYAAYLRKGADGCWHIIPCVEPEQWGVYPEFSRNQDVTSSLAMFRWALRRAAEAAEVLNVDAPLRSRWRELAANLAPYPRFETPEGPILPGQASVAPRYAPGDHPIYPGAYPVTLADDITLDSPAELKQLMVRTARALEFRSNAEGLVLTGACPETVAASGKAEPKPIASLETLRSEVVRYPERLLNSRSGRIHLFPCVPKQSVVAFRRFQARGGFVVSAARNASGVMTTEIEARRDGVCRLMNPWTGAGVTVTDKRSGKSIPVKVDTSNGECLMFAARAGASYRVTRS